MVTLFWFNKHNKDKRLILGHRKMKVLYVWLVSSKFIYRLQSYGKSPFTSGSPLVNALSAVYVLQALIFHKRSQKAYFYSISGFNF